MKDFLDIATRWDNTLLPRNAVSAQLQATSELSLAAQYFLDWKPLRVPEAGSFLGGQDMILGDGESLYVGPAQRMLRGDDLNPKKSGDWGLAARCVVPKEWRRSGHKTTKGYYPSATKSFNSPLLRPPLRGV